MLTTIVFLPLAGALLLLLIENSDGRRDAVVRWAALAVSLAVFAATLLLWSRFDPASAEFQFVERRDWIPSFGIQYHVGVDGISLFLLVLTGVLTPLALLSSWESVRKKVKEFSAFMLVLEFAMMGVFVAQDLFLFYVFWEISLVPMYFIIGIWGARAPHLRRRQVLPVYEAGSILMLRRDFAWMGSHFGTSTCRRSRWPAAGRRHRSERFPVGPTELLLFLGFFIAFAIKVPIWPLHSWLPDAHVQAPTAGSVILAGVLLKLGTYGLVRFTWRFFPPAR